MNKKTLHRLTFLCVWVKNHHYHKNIIVTSSSPSSSSLPPFHQHQEDRPWAAVLQKGGWRVPWTPPCVHTQGCRCHCPVSHLLRCLSREHHSDDPGYDQQPKGTRYVLSDFICQRSSINIMENSHITWILTLAQHPNLIWSNIFHTYLFDLIHWEYAHEFLKSWAEYTIAGYMWIG